MYYNCNICNSKCSFTNNKYNYENSNTCSIKCNEIQIYKIIYKNIQLPDDIIFIISKFLFTNKYFTENKFNLKKYL
jgi:hypothetical protein